jgi:hypothetical protein
MRKSLVALSAVLLLLSLTACEETDLPPVWIKPVEHTVDELPPLPERGQKVVFSQHQVLSEVQSFKRDLEQLGGQIDLATAYGAYLDCEEYVRYYREIAGLPVLEASGADELTQWASEEYNQAVDHILENARDLYQTCGAALKGTAKDEPVHSLRLEMARDGAAEAVETFEQIIYRLEEETFDAQCEVIETQLEAMRCTRKQIERLGGVVDRAVRSGLLSCQYTVDTYDSIVNAPTFDVSDEDEVTRWAYNRYREAVALIEDRGRDMSENCRSWLVDPNEDGVVPFQQWGLARDSVNEALDMLIPAIERLEQR